MLRLAGVQLPQHPPGLSLAAQQALFAQAWPGNARQLNHVLRRALALGAGPVIETPDLFDIERDVPPRATPEQGDRSLNQHLEAAERTFIVTALQTHQGVVTEAAAHLGISRKTLWEKMRRHGIDKHRVGPVADAAVDVAVERN